MEPSIYKILELIAGLCTEEDKKFNSEVQSQGIRDAIMKKANEGGDDPLKVALGKFESIPGHKLSLWGWLACDHQKHNIKIKEGVHLRSFFIITPLK